MKQKVISLMILLVLSLVIANACFSAPGDLKTKGNVGGSADDFAYGLAMFGNDSFVIAGEAAQLSCGTGDFDTFTPKGGVDGICVFFDYDSTANKFDLGYRFNYGGNGYDTFRYVNVNTYPNKAPHLVMRGFSDNAALRSGDWTGVWPNAVGGNDATMVYFHTDTKTFEKYLQGTVNSDKAYGGYSDNSINMGTGESGGHAATFSGSVSPIVGSGTSCFYDMAAANETGFYLVSNVGYASMTEINTSANWAGLDAKGLNDAVISLSNDTSTVKFNFGGLGNDEFKGTAILNDRNVVAVGFSESFSFNEEGDWDGISGKGGTDAIAVKYSKTGNILWKKNFGGSGTDVFNKVVATADGGFAAVGYASATSFGTGDWGAVDGMPSISSKGGGTDAIIVKFDTNGNVLWRKNFGGADDDRFENVKVRYNGDIIAVGNSYEGSFENGDLGNIVGKGLSDIIFAVFEDVTYYSVKFMKYPNNMDTISGEKLVASGTTVTPLSGASRMGFTLGGWYANEECTIPFNFNTPITKDTYVYPKWTPSNSTIGNVTLTYNNGSGSNTIETMAYGTYFTVEAIDIPGSTFSHWKNGSNGIRSYDSKYSFYVTENITLTAVYNSLAPKVPSINIDTTNFIASAPYSYDWNKTQYYRDISFFGNMMVPEGYTLVERGFLGSYAAYNVTLANFTIGRPNVTKVVVPGTHEKIQGVFKGVWINYAYNARTYLIYSDGTTNYTIYSPVLSNCPRN